MQRIAFALLVAAVLAGPALAASWVTGAFRPSGGGVVRPGDTMIEVQQSAGMPAQRRIISHGIALGGLVGLTQEQWIYRGSDGVYILTFVGHKVAQIEVVPRR